MSGAQKRTPEVRFKGFTDDWEQRKFIEIAPLQRGFDLPVSEREAGLYPVIMSNGIGAFHSKYKAKAPGVVTGRSGTIGNLTFVETDYWPHNTTLWVTDFKNNDAKYIYYLYLKLNLKRFGTGSGVPTLNRNDVHDTITNIPSVSEQKIISRLFSNLDNLIVLHQRKLDLLKQLKQAYLQVLFPIEGEKTPKIRFAHFEGDWEQRKASEIFKSVSDKGHIQLPVLSASQEKGMVLRDEIGIDIKYREDSLNTYKRVLPGQFVIHLRSFQGGFAYSNIEGITSPAYTILDFIDKIKQNSLFWKIVLTSNNFIKKLETVTYGIRDGRSISYSDFSTLKFLIPHVSEQEKIGHLLLNIENTINLHAEKIKALEKIKKLYLQKLFV